MASQQTFFGRVLRVDLTQKKVTIETPPQTFFRQYYGGSIGAYYLLTEAGPGLDPLGPENILTFTPGFLAHLPVGAYNRVAVTAKSPLTGAIIDSQAGGYWGPECKMAGFDAVVIKGRADYPVYLLIQSGKAEIRDARSVWGMETGPAEEAIKQDSGETHLRICIIGPAGENLVRYANIANNLRHFAGRGGLGAVMGSKNLKAVAVKSQPAGSPGFTDRERVLSILKQINQAYAQDDQFSKLLTPYGTPWGLWFNQEHGRLPTYNYRDGVFDGAGIIDHRAMEKHEMTQPSVGCFACTVKCKRSMALDKPEVHIEKRYGGAEYESMGNLGPLLGISDPVAIEKANELCSKYTIDTISCGATLAWAIDCFQRGLITLKNTGGESFNWGDAENLIKWINLIAFREGFGTILAEGSIRAAAHFGPEAESLAVQCKGMEWPAVEPRVEPAQALAYAVNPIGTDHMTMGGTDCGPEFLELETPPREEGMSPALVKAYYLQRTLGSLIDGFGICRFLIGSTGIQHTIDLIESAVGWKTSLWELMRAGDRRMVLFRSFNAREGLTAKDDRMPERAFLPIEKGPETGTRIDREELRRAIKLYYEISGWDPQTGWPTYTKLLDLGLDWVVDAKAPRPADVKTTEQAAHKESQ